MIDPYFYGMCGVAGFLACSNFYALNGWRKAQKARDIARDDAAYQQWCVGLAKKANADTIARLIDTEDQLRRIERQRSDNTRRGNLTKSAQRKALIASKAAELNQNVADRARKPRLAA